jgi:hypothetical protein
MPSRPATRHTLALTRILPNHVVLISAHWDVHFSSNIPKPLLFFVSWHKMRNLSCDGIGTTEQNDLVSISVDWNYQ